MQRLTAIIVLSLTAGGLAACRGDDQDATRPQGPPIAVTVTPAMTVDAAARLEAGGVVSAVETAVISSRIVATIADVSVTAGDRVRAGDVLVRIDAADVVERTHQARAAALAAEKALAQARTEQTAADANQRLAAAWHTRITALHARNSATDQERDEAEARLSAAAARVAGSQAATELADANLVSARANVAGAAATESYTLLRAPFNGLIIERLVDPGNLAAPGMPLLRIESDGTRQVVAQVDEARVSYVQPGDQVDVEIDAPGDSGDDASIQGTVAEVARAVGADQRAFTVKVTLPRSVTARTGTFARVIFRGATRRALVVPASAIRRQGQVSSIFVVQDGVARLRLIQAGPPLSEGIEVLSGLDNGEVVVTIPVAGLADGVNVAAGSSRPAQGVTR